MLDFNREGWRYVQDQNYLLKQFENTSNGTDERILRTTRRIHKEGKVL